jgi:hypothetical protein
MTAKTEISPVDLEKRQKELLAERDSLLEAKNRITAEEAVRKRHLKEKMEAAKKLGFDPNTLADDIKKAKEIAAVKQETFAAELSAAEKILRPMLEAIEKS